MFSPESVKAIHHELQTWLPRTTVLVGGSYLFGEATEASDLDIYVIASWWALWSVRTVLRRFRLHYPDRQISIMLVPRIFFKRGWYYIYGKTIDGTVYQTPLNRQAVIRNTFKVAYFYYLNSKLHPSEELTRQIIKRIGIVKQLLSDKNFTGPIRKINAAPLNEEIAVVLEKLWAEAGSYFAFSFANYITYNLRYCSQGELLFLNKNPDTLLVVAMRQALARGVTDQDLTWFKKYIFPVLMY